MIWQDKISDILDLIGATSIYNTARSTTPANLNLKLVNQAKDWLCTYKPWRDLQVLVQLPLGTDRKVTLPSDFGSVIEVFIDASNIGKPSWWYTLRDNDVAKRYDEEVVYDVATGFVRKFVFPPTVYIPQNPWVRYSKVVADYTGTGIEFSFFPKNIMLLVVKKILQDYYGVNASDDPKWISMRVSEELRMLEAYAYNNNVALDMSVKDRYGNPIRISGGSLDGSRSGTNFSPYVPSTMFTGGTM